MLNGFRQTMKKADSWKDIVLARKRPADSDVIQPSSRTTMNVPSALKSSMAQNVSSSNPLHPSTKKPKREPFQNESKSISISAKYPPVSNVVVANVISLNRKSRTPPSITTTNPTAATLVNSKAMQDDDGFVTISAVPLPPIPSKAQQPQTRSTMPNFKMYDPSSRKQVSATSLVVKEKKMVSAGKYTESAQKDIVRPPPISTFDGKRLSDEQQRLFDKIVRGESLFFTGSAGSGKSFVLKALIRYFRTLFSYDKVAVTGIEYCCM